MERTLYLRAAALYLPICCALLAGRLRPQPPRQLAACLLSFLWTLPLLLALQCIDRAMQWWTFSGEGPQIRGLPIELYLGWAVLWGLLPQLAWPRLAIWKSALLMVAIDMVAMPLCAPAVQLGPRWLLGEACAVATVLLPALSIARWTLDSSHLRSRVLLQVAIAAGLFLFVVPETAFALRPGLGWEPLFTLPSWQRQVWLQMVLILALPGLSAAMEFAQCGRGTPIPYDPPQWLVTSGIYRYVANPMQMSCCAVMLAWAALLRDPWLLLPAAVSVVYSAGIANWDEGDDLGRRFGADWVAYRAVVQNWLPRWHPYHGGPAATVYIASSCGPCTEVRAWLERRQPHGLSIVAAETLPPGSIQRMRYVPGDGSAKVEGVRAFGRAIEHLNFGWAMVGATLRLPGAWQFIQLMLDAGGLGPRHLSASGEDACAYRAD